jgi:hypothetical protein
MAYARTIIHDRTSTALLARILELPVSDVARAAVYHERAAPAVPIARRIGTAYL